MFEKEAHEFQKQIQQEYLDLGKNCAYPPLWERIGELWGKGAEFGYNKAFVEADKNLKAVVADFNKANEWHCVKDGDLPKENKRYLCYIKSFVGSGNVCICLDYDIQYNSWKDCYDDVIAWKEIVLPEEFTE